MRRLALVLAGLLALANAHAGQKMGSIVLCNEDNFDDITVTWKYVHADAVKSNLTDIGNASWNQDIGGAVVRCLDLEPERNTAVVRPGERFELIDYYIHWRDVDKVEGIPLMRQLRAIYRKLEIRFPDGAVITLDTIGECMARKWVSSSYYIYICNPGHTVEWESVKEI